MDFGFHFSPPAKLAESSYKVRLRVIYQIQSLFNTEAGRFLRKQSEMQISWPGGLGMSGKKEFGFGVFGGVFVYFLPKQKVRVNTFDDSSTPLPVSKFLAMRLVSCLIKIF